MLIEFDLNHNDVQALLHHCTEYQPSSEDFRENARLREALETLAEAINDAINPSEESPESSETIDPRLLDAAMAIFGDKKSAVDWLSKPLRALGAKRPKDVSIEQALLLFARIEHGFGA
ncbi:antitoxin Xre/MbcA/ParS toxin-binding domain-containing protein [Pseudomonas saponiphila]|uniref:antitoxin Xre/MbcA/ParS toxin-binding domain-containing protein n=1 Tax=Pseudomonas saponiphila TaxID=556534 RepID=UPI00223F97FA|nr:antitoxin Xre/MbcA/ParS toxin-binding domain-containing protein [Pseudomonas saponiphila]